MHASPIPRTTINPNLRSMKVVAAYLLAVLGGNTNPSAEDLKNILASVGAEAEYEKIELLLGGVKGKDITELIAMGRERLASVPGGGGGGGGVVSTNYNGGDSGSGGACTEEAEKEAKKEEMKEESDEDMCFSLFD